MSGLLITNSRAGGRSFLRSNGSYTLHETGYQDQERWVSTLCHVLYTLHRGRDREPLFSIVPVAVSAPIQCV